MSYRISVGGGPGDALRESIVEQVQRAAQRLESELQDDPVEAIHGARKSIKKARSALRLGRGALGRDVAAQENAALRDAAALLSAARDADVLLATLAALEPRVVGRVPETSVTSLREHFSQQAAAERPDASGSGVGAARALLRGVVERSAGWPLHGMDTAAVAAGLARGYGRGRRERARARREPTAEQLHQWRKRAKDLWYHLRLVRDAWPQILEPLAEEAHRLTELLGDDHDLSVLTERVRARGAEQPDADLLLEVVDDRRAELQAEAFALADRLYAESEKAFHRRLRRYLSAWEAGAVPTTVEPPS
jgi:CHAD domain-containing protein